MALIAEQLANMEAMSDAIRVQQKITRRQHRNLILLLLGLMYKHKARAEKLNINIQEQIDKNLHQHDNDSQATDHDHTIHDETACGREYGVATFLGAGLEQDVGVVRFPVVDRHGRANRGLQRLDLGADDLIHFFHERILHRVFEPR